MMLYLGAIILALECLQRIAEGYEAIYQGRGWYAAFVLFAAFGTACVSYAVWKAA